jgi:general stress protein 26
MATRNETTAQLGKLMQNIDIAMFTTVGKGGYLVSRPLSTQSAEFDGESVWFFTDAGSPKVAEIRRHPKVKLGYASKERNTYISAAGDASLDRDPARIAQFWSDALKAFFPRGKDDPDLALIRVRLRTIEYWDGPGSMIGKAISFVVARVTGNDDVMAKNRIVDLASGKSIKPPASDRAPRKRRSATAAKRALAPAPKAARAGATKAATARKPAAKRVAKSTPKRSAPTGAKQRAPRKTSRRR